MKHFSFLLLFLYSSVLCTAQLPVTVDSIYSLIKARSIYRNHADWIKIDSSFKNKLQKAKNDLDSLKSLLPVFELLGDVHSNINYKNNTYSNYPSFDDATLQYLIPLVQKSQEQDGKIKTCLIEHHFAYIQIPGIQAWGEQINTYAKAISDSLCALPLNKIKGYIIDLRLNSGGQLSSMVSGLNMLLGEVYLGGGMDANNNESYLFTIKDSNFHINGMPMTRIQNNCKPNQSNKPVVLIIGPATRSSGSILAIAFKQRPYTLFIGEPTADGYSTGNDYFYFGPNLNLNLSTSYSQDRKKNVYKNSIPPDLIIKGGDNFEVLTKDLKVQAALEWLKKEKR